MTIMTRKEEIKQTAKLRADQYKHPIVWSGNYYGFISGAEWADKTMLERLREFIDHHTDIKDVYKFINIMQK